MCVRVSTKLPFVSSKHAKRRLDKIVKKGGQVVGINGQSTEEAYFRKVRHKLATILNDSTHRLYSVFDSSWMEGSGRQSPTRKNESV